MLFRAVAENNPEVEFLMTIQTYRMLLDAGHALNIEPDLVNAFDVPTERHALTRQRDPLAADGELKARIAIGVVDNAWPALRYVHEDEIAEDGQRDGDPFEANVISRCGLQAVS